MAVYSEGLNRQYIKCSHVPGDKKIKKKKQIKRTKAKYIYKEKQVKISSKS